MIMKTQRLTILVSPAERVALSDKAASLGVSDSELVRLAVSAYEAEADPEWIEAVAAEISASVQHMTQCMDEAHAAIEAMQANKQRLQHREAA